MSIRSRQQEVQLLMPQESLGSFGTDTDYVFERNIQMAISLISGSAANTNSTIYTSSTHIGLTQDRNVTPQHKVSVGDAVFTVTYVNNDGRYSTVFLSLAL